MLKSNCKLIIFIVLAAIVAGCAKKAVQTPMPAPQPVSSSSYVAPQSAPVLPPSYPSLAGDVVQPATASIPIVQGR